ncbi:MAG: tRNA isopentenyl-2-thiomethyl-A-37 hydroxylase MiaE [Spongiibacteraceae bacterium]|jgi:tRNA-(ms[2]io[6]A)-hydroxylase|nr:tRNA isopentenyl-2-thiomethyl-A-37 hydroxylase MiaE [Spongiibacteraceae bacterium]
MSALANNLAAIHDFLPCRTPDAWLEAAVANQTILLIDHANCEKKAASTALNLLYRYVDKPDLIWRMSRLAREELRHFEQVTAIMAARDVDYVHISSARYAAGLHAHIRTHEPAKLVDILIVGAYIEARSCERFERLAPLLDDELRRFYEGLLASEARHFQSYLKLAARYADGPIDDRIAHFAEVERELIESPDTAFRFHSGPPACV